PLSSSLHHLVLHSLPTRRSSDLDLPVYRKEAKKLGAKGFINKEVAPEDLLHILDAINNGSTYFENTGSFVEELTETEKQVLRMLDRKSTRLNSSHVSISYAVFCL